ncbi:hypothetical protein ACHAWF_018560 [Thalassiosira exigua]
MDEVDRASKRLRTTRETIEERYQKYVRRLDDAEAKIKARFDALESKIDDVAKKHGRADASANDVVKINAGGRIVAVRRDKLCQIKGSRLEALFCGRWDERLPRDGAGNVFLDVNPTCFRAIVDYLNELAISTPRSLPRGPSLGEGYDSVLRQQLYLLDLCDYVKKPPLHNKLDSKITNDDEEINMLYEWLHEEKIYGELNLIFRMTRDSTSDSRTGGAPWDFHKKCDKKGPTISLMKTTEGFVIGGYSSESWISENTGWGGGDIWAERAFLFHFGNGTCPRKMKLRNYMNKDALCGGMSCGPAFGRDLYSMGSQLDNGNETIFFHFNPGRAYEPSGNSHIEDLGRGGFHAVEVEVFQVGDWYDLEYTDIGKSFQFSKDVNDALNDKLKALQEAEGEINSLEHKFAEEMRLVEFFAAKSADIIELNVSGSIMVTTRSTLQFFDDSVLARQFDEVWTNTGCKNENIPLDKWGSDDVCAWIKDVNGISDEAVKAFEIHTISGSELVVLGKEGLAMMGISRPGTVCLLLDRIEKLKKASEEMVRLIEHSPYCFEKILDFLRMKDLFAEKFVRDPPLPRVCEEERERFVKIVDYYFPGDSSRLILG